MNAWGIIFIAVMLWSMASVSYVISRLGHKNKPVTGFRKWAEFVLAPPVLILAGLVGFLGWLSERNR